MNMSTNGKTQQLQKLQFAVPALCSSYKVDMLIIIRINRELYCLVKPAIIIVIIIIVKFNCLC